MVDFKEIISPETWELFARDLLVEQGFHIESSPDRGADAGKDLLVTEDLKGTLNNYRFRWLVSCKHFVVSGKAVNETDEQNILERIKSFKADGFIGFYSTISSAALNTRLNHLRENLDIKDYKIFDHKLIESFLIRIGYSDILQRYFPASFKEIKPINLVLSEYSPILCKVCGKDLLLSLFQEDYKANFISVYKIKNRKHYIDDVYCVCKGACDRSIEDRYIADGFIIDWEDISDLIIPAKFLKHIMTMMNVIKSGRYVYSKKAFEKEKLFLIALSQKILRSTTEKEKQRVVDLNKFGLF